jgi:hypothetical protein
VPAAVYDKAKSDGIIGEKLGADALWLHLKPLWAEDRPHVPVAEIAEWFATYVYLPKLRDRVVLEAAIRHACAKLDPAFAERFDEAAGRYVGLVWQKAPGEPLPPTAVLVRPEVAIAQLRPVTTPAQPAMISGCEGGYRRGLATDFPARIRARPQRFSRGGSTARSRSTWSGR